MGSSAIFVSRLFFLSPTHKAQDPFCGEIGRTARQSWGDGISPLLSLLVDHTNNIFPPSYTLCYFPVHLSGGDSWFCNPGLLTSGTIFVFTYVGEEAERLKSESPAKKFQS